MARSSATLRQPPPAKPKPSRGGNPHCTAAWFIVPALAATIVTASTASRAATEGTSFALVTGWWLLSLFCLILATTSPNLFRHALRVKSPSLRQAAPWIGMTAIAAVPRLILLDRFPTVLDGDESAFIIRAVAFRQGTMPDWFGISFYGNANAWSAAQGLVVGLAGDGVIGHRTLSALVGTIGVLATWRFGRSIVGPPAAVIGAILLAIWPLHVHLSRVALNNITDPTALALALLFLARAVTFRRRIDAVACGLALAFGFYGYYGGRAFPAVIVVLLLVLALHYRLGVKETVRLLAWIVTAFIVATMPLLVTFRQNPVEFGGHMEMVSPYTLANFRAHPTETIRLFLSNLRDAATYPFEGNGVGYFRHEPPYFGWPLCILIAAGVITLLVQLVQTREVGAFACLAIPWSLLTAGIAVTSPISGQRFLALTPVFALIAGAGLWQLANLLARVTLARFLAWPRVLAIAIVAVISASHLTWMTSEDRQIETYGDYRTIAAWDLGWRLTRTSAEPSRVIYFAGAPFVWSQSFPSLTYLTGGLPMTDIDTPLETTADVPPLPAGAMLVLVPERSSERCIIEAALPGVTVTEARARDGMLLYSVFSTGPPPDWSTITTLAGTTTVPASPACGMARITKIGPVSQVEPPDVPLPTTPVETAHLTPEPDHEPGLHSQRCPRLNRWRSGLHDL